MELKAFIVKTKALVDKDTGLKRKIRNFEVIFFLESKKFCEGDIKNGKMIIFTPKGFKRVKLQKRYQDGNIFKEPSKYPDEIYDFFLKIKRRIMDEENCNNSCSGKPN